MKIAEALASAFSFLGPDCGLVLECKHDHEAKWNSADLRLTLYLDPQDFLLQGWIAPIRSSWEQARLPIQYLVNARDAPGWRWPWQFANQARAIVELPKVAATLRPYLQSALRNFPRTYKLAMRRYDVESERLTVDAELAPHLRAADAAWVRKDYKRVVQLLRPLGAQLGAAHARRLAYAMKKAT